ncbi:GGDEF domain-containing response regulator [Butyrivibrio sp. VCB2006]|uniref:GGDEF domain-containing response regulator n=1 Tax=Butyrivibrio sp. VCB2006 TaxID=1280679 RepID=UPI000418485F|nr:diguanylate cyclase [Butyrivibrio sp. VCB2006]
MDKRRILVVDDDSMFCKQTERILSGKYEVITADSGKAAIDLYESAKPDMILSDLMMPGMDGFEMMDALREKYNFVIPVMYMTGLAGDDSEEKSLTTGAVDYIRKPFKADVLLRRVDNIMDNLGRIQGLRQAAENDPMTGLYNKTTSASKIDELVKKGNGILMMIDLDSFKLVNDIYGHEKGDMILIKFAEMLRSVMRSTDIIGRIGGDEFIAFCQNTRDERMLRERCEFLNRKILSYAKECLAEDMNIPLGCSIGASICPDEGTDYTTLFKKADQALYEVKQNGKHGFFIFKKVEEDNSEKESAGSFEIRKILGEREGQKGAYVIPLDMFTNIYRFLMRFERNYAYGMYFLIFTLKSSQRPVNECVDEFVETLASCLRGSDVITKYGNDKVLTLLMKASEEDYQVPVDRIMGKWNDTQTSKEVEVKIDAEKLFI